MRMTVSRRIAIETPMRVCTWCDIVVRRKWRALLNSEKGIVVTYLFPAGPRPAEGMEGNVASAYRIRNLVGDCVPIRPCERLGPCGAQRDLLHPAYTASCLPMSTRLDIKRILVSAWCARDATRSAGATEPTFASTGTRGVSCDYGATLWRIKIV